MHFRVFESVAGRRLRCVVSVALVGMFSSAAVARGVSGLPASVLRELARPGIGAFAAADVPRLAALTPAERASLAESLSTRPVPVRVATWALLQVGTPYRLGPLGEGAPPDSDPPFAIEASDCTSLLVTSVALAQAPERDVLAGVARAHYRDGRVRFEDRLHFTTDRLDASPCWRDVTRDVGRTRCRRTEVVLNRRADGSSWVKIPWTRERSVSWIARSDALRFPLWARSGRVPPIVGVAFVQQRRLRDGLDVVHEGLLIDGRTLVHASSQAGRVVDVSWADYLAGAGRRHDGVVVFEFR